MNPASLREVFGKYYGTLESLSVEYLAYGGIAVAVWGDPRETQDVDAVVALDDEYCDGLLRSLASVGFSYEADAAKTFPIDGWIRLTFRGRHADLALGRTPFDQSALGRRHRTTLFDREVWIVSPEDLILYKLIAYRYKDLADAEAVVVRQAEELDIAYLRHWALEIARHTMKFEIPQKLEEILEQTDRP